MNDASASGHLVGVFAHPDDEAYAAGGLLKKASSSGWRVTVVCATRGEAGVDRRGPTTRAQLAETRTAELSRSCSVLGADPPVFLDLPDGAVDAAHGHPRLAAALAPLGPDLVVTLGPDGAYGHRDHLAVTRMLDDLAQQNPWELLHVAFPPSLFASVHRALSKVVPELIAPVASLGTPDDAVDLRLDIRPFRNDKLDAIVAHASQLRGNDPYTFLKPGLISDMLASEQFVLAHGHRVAHDENGARDLTRALFI